MLTDIDGDVSSVVVWMISPLIAVGIASYLGEKPGFELFITWQDKSVSDIKNRAKALLTTYILVNHLNQNC